MFLAFGMATGVASADGLEGTPFEAGANANALDLLARGATVTRTSADSTLTQEDRSRFRAMGLMHPHAAIVVLHKIRRTDEGRQLARLKVLARSLDKFAASDACDRIVATGESRAMCSGHVAGPFGKVAVRMPVAARLTESPGGVMQFLITNDLPLEAKPLFGWREVVAPGHLKVAYDMFPTDDGWLVYARLGVEMSNHESSAKDVAEALMKLESWLTKDLERT